MTCSQSWPAVVSALLLQPDTLPVCLSVSECVSGRGYYTAGKWRLPTEERCKINEKK